MFRNDGANPGPGNSFVEGDSQAGTPATQPTGQWLTTIQEEVARVIEQTGAALNKADNTQLDVAIRSLMRNGNKNKLHNSTFRILNRTGGVTGAQTVAGFATDRWRMGPGTGGTASYSCQSSNTANTPTSPDGWVDAGTLTITQSVAGSTAPFVQQRHEDYNRFAGIQMTLSVWMKVASGTLVVSPQHKQFFGSAGSAAVTTVGPNFNVTTTWQKFTWTFTVPSVVGKTTAGTAPYSEISFVFPTATTFTLVIYQPQFEVGGSATAFDAPDVAIEEQICERYFETSARLGTVFQTYDGVSVGSEGGTEAQTLSTRFRTKKAAIPAIVWYSPQSGAAGNIYWNSADRAVTQTKNTSVQSTGWPVVGSTIAASADYAHWTADSEP